MKRTYTWLSLIVFVLTFSSGAIAQENLSLSEAIGNALANNYNIRITKKVEEISGINNTWGAAGRLPTINFDIAQSNRMDFNENNDFTSNTVNPGLDLSWVIFDGFSIRIRKEVLESLSERSRGNTAVLVENTIQAVILSYYNALLQKEKFTVVKELMDLSKDRYDYVETRKEIGNAVSFEVLQAKNAWLEDKSNYLLQELSFNNTVRDLNYLMGVTEDKTYNFTEDFSAVEKDYRFEDLKQKMISNNKTLKNQYISETLLKKDVRLVRSRYYPSLSLRTGTDAFTTRMKLEGMDADTSSSHNYFANLSLTFNLFDGGSKKRALEIARIQEDIGKTETDEMIHSLTNDLEKLNEMFSVRKNLLSVAEENLEAASLNMRISEDKFKVGAINSFNYRDIQLIYLNASIMRLQATYNLIDSNTALLRITGGIITER